MFRDKSFTFQIVVIGGFFFCFYMFFALTTSIYDDYKLETEIEEFEAEIEKLADYANQKPDDLKYLSSDQYKDRYAKENLNLLNPGEKLIILPVEKQVVEQGPAILMTDILSPDSVLNKTNRQQWWEYYFGKTLSVSTPTESIAPEKFYEEEEIIEEAEG